MPLTVLDVDGFIRHAMFKYPPPDLTWHCRKSIFIEDTATKLGKILPLFRNKPSHEDDDIVEPDIILTWGGFKADHHRYRYLWPAYGGISTQDLPKII